MDVGNDIFEAADLLADRSRAKMLVALSDGCSLPASELARIAGIALPTASLHLRRLTEKDWVVVEKVGRHRYYRLAVNENLRNAIEALSALSSPPRVKSLKDSIIIPTLKTGRTCYDHLAGMLGVTIAKTLLERQVVIENSNGFYVTSDGGNWFSSFGINIEDVQKTRRKFAPICVDWTERRHHIGGALGAAIYSRFMELSWIVKSRDSRAVSLTPTGAEGLQSVFGIEWIQNYTGSQLDV